MFDKKREAIWRLLAEQLQGKYVEGGFWKGDKVQVNHADWTITLDRYVVSTGKVTIILTRIRAPFVAAKPLRFTVSRTHLFSAVSRMLGLMDIEVGDPPFDKDFVIKSNDEMLIRQFLGSKRLRDLIAGQKDIKFALKDDEGWFGSKFPPGVDELVFDVVGVISDLDRLKQLFDLFGVALDELVRIGVATPEPPNVALK